jgi:uncharacterized protein YqjF (DUF2071 family)
MGKCRYTDTIVNLGTRWRDITFKPWPIYPQDKSIRGTSYDEKKIKCLP